MFKSGKYLTPLASVVDPHRTLYTLMRIRILVKVIRTRNHWPTDPPQLHCDL
jgi:hypothetical protein